MTCKGTVRNSTVVLEPGSELPDGTLVQVALDGPWADEISEAPKERLWQVLRSLPEDVALEDVIEQVYLLFKIDRGVRQLDAGEGIPHEEAKERFRQWLE